MRKVLIRTELKPPCKARPGSSILFARMIEETDYGGEIPRSLQIFVTREPVQLPVSWDSGQTSISAIDVHSVISTFPEELTTVSLKMSDDIYPFHAYTMTCSDMLADDLMFFHKGFLGEDAIGLERHFNGFPEVYPGLFEGFPLSIGARQFLDESDVSLGDFSENRGQFHNSKSFKTIGGALFLPVLYSLMHLVQFMRHFLCILSALVFFHRKLINII